MGNWKVPCDTSLNRLRRLLKVFLAEEDEQAPEVALKIAEHLREDSKHDRKETTEAYANASAIAQTFPFDDTEEREWALRDAVGDWAEYLAEQQDISNLVSLVRTVGSDKELIEAVGAGNLVHRMRASGNIDPAIEAAKELSAEIAAVKANLEVANICAEWAQALADSGRSPEAIEVCERALSSGWLSRDLANRHSLILERAKDWHRALEVCNMGLELAPGDEQLSKRRARCLQHL